MYLLESLWAHFTDGEMKRLLGKGLGVWRKVPPYTASYSHAWPL